MSTGARVREVLEDTNPEAILFDGLDECLVGISNDDRAVYSEGAILTHLVEDEGMTVDDAREWFAFNIAGLYAGPLTPVIVDFF